MNLIFLLFFYLLITKKAFIKPDIINLSALTHLIVVTIGAAIGVNAEHSFSRIDDIFNTIFIFLFFRAVYFENLTFAKVANILFLSFIITLLLGIYNYYVDGSDFLKLKSIGSVNRSAVYMIFMLCIALGLYFHTKQKLYLYLSVITFISAFLSGSRMAIFSLPLVILIAVKIYNRFELKKICIFISLFIFISIVVAILYEDSRLGEKIMMGFKDPSRLHLWTTSLYVWYENNWLFGVGMGNSIQFYPSDYIANPVINYIDNAHNTFLDMLLERGLLGLITYLSFTLSLLAFFLSKKQVNSVSGYYKIGALIIISSYIMSFANITFRQEFALLCALIWGLLTNDSFKHAIQKTEAS